MEENKPNKGIKSYIYYVAIIVVVLIITIVTFSYAYFDAVDKNNNNATVNIGGKTACIDVEVSGNTINNLTYNYPITDDFALQNNHVTPIEVTVTNTCTEGDAIDYSIILTALSTGTNYIPDSKIKVKVDKVIGSTSPENVISTKMLNTMTSLPNGTTKTLLEQKINDLENKKYSSYTKSSYVIEAGKVENGKPVKYKTYLWIDSTAETSIENQKFESIVGVVINNPETNVKK